MEETHEQKPGAMALIAIKNQKKSIVVFKKPAEPAMVKKKTKNVILTEEKYMEVCINFNFIFSILIRFEIYDRYMLLIHAFF